MEHVYPMHTGMVEWVAKTHGIIPKMVAKLHLWEDPRKLKEK